MLVSSTQEWVRAWKPGVSGIHEVFHARFVEHAYPRHTHDTWTVFMVDQGAIRYDLETRHRGVAGARVSMLPPHVVHDGRAATQAGFRKRVLYVDTDVLAEGLIARAVDAPDIEDPVTRGTLDRLHRALEHPGETFAAESLFAVVARRMKDHLGAAADAHPERSDTQIACDLRDLLDDRSSEPLTLRDASDVLHVSPAHLVKTFTRAFGIAPHRYLVGRRIDAARRHLLEGRPPAEVAVSVGFHDQAHLTRHFKRHVGTTPARFASSRRHLETPGC